MFIFLYNYYFHRFLILKDTSLVTTVLVGMVQLAERKHGVALGVTVPLGLKASFAQVRTLCRNTYNHKRTIYKA